MILLNGHSLTPARKVPLEAMSLQLKERESTATITPADMTGIGVNSWFKDDTDPGKDIVWRVRSIGTAYATNTPTVQLEHAISILKDIVLFGEITPAVITGNKNSKTCTAEQAVRFILSKCGDWTLGGISYSVSNPYKFDGDSLFDALETISDSLSDPCWTYDFSTYPFKLYIKPADTSVGSEMRAGRNLRTITRTVDRSGMYTRFYPIGENDLHISGEYVSKNEGTYGTICHVETANDIDTEAELRRWANEKLAKHCEPTVTIDIDGFELVKATGEPLDRLTLGRACRVPLPEFGTTIQEKITALSYQDKIFQPELVKVTLANNRTDVTRIIADSMKKSGRSSRSSAKKDKKDNAWFEDTNDHVSMCAIGIIGKDADGNPNWVRLSELVVDGTGIHSQVQSVQNNLVIAQTKITQNENEIKLEAQRRTAKDEILEGKIVVAAGQVGMVVKMTDNREVRPYARRAVFPTPGNTRYIYLDLEKGVYYEWKNNKYVVTTPGKEIAAGQICVAINDSNETEATIEAAKIHLLGETIANKITANYIKSKVADISVLGVQAISSSGNISVSNGYIMAPYFYLGTVGNARLLSGAITALNIKRSGNTYTLQKQDFDDTGWVDVGSFSRAVSSWTWGGGNGKVNVTALPQDQTKSVNLSIDGNSSITSNGTYTYTVDYENADGDDVSTGATKTVTVNVPSSGTISINAPRDSYSSQPSDTTQIWANLTFANNKWYKFKVTCGSSEKWYAVKIQT